MQWFELRIRLPDAIRDGVINHLFEIGAEGVEEENPEAPGTISAFFSQSRRPQVERELTPYLKSVAALFPGTSVPTPQFLDVKAENWGEKYKEFYHAQKLSHHFYLVPEWERSKAAVPPEMIPIYMEPGQAFGTGLHPSTRLCLRFLERLILWYPDPRRVHFLDVGTGTGILAIAAAKLGIGSVEALDIDPVAVATAQENFALNACPVVRLSGLPLSRAVGEFDILLSNILLETHRELVREYRKHIRRGGYLVLSGLLVPQLEEARRFVEEAGFIEESRASFQEWGALLFIRAR